MPKIVIDSVSKKIKKNVVLSEINLNLDSGVIYGLYGRNGSGKTMLLRAIAGLIKIDSGKIIIDKKILHKDLDFPDELGLIIEHTDLLPQYTGYQNLKILAGIKKIAGDEDIFNTLKAVKLFEHKDKKVKEYSLGMKQRLSIAQAIFEKPNLILLDEPTNALDEDSIIDIRTLLLNLKKEKCTIIIASHNKDDLNVLADEIIFMENGKISNLNKDAVL